VAYPNTLYMCCPTGDGSGAAVLMSAKAIKKYTTTPIKVAANVLTTDPYTSRNLVFPDINTMVKNAAKQAYAQSGLGQIRPQVDGGGGFAHAAFLVDESVNVSH